MISEERIKLIADTFFLSVENIKEFLRPPRNEEETRFARFRFMFLAERRKEGSPYIEYCLLSKQGRFIRLLDEVSSSVDIREAAYHIISVEPEAEELDIVWDENYPTKQYYLIRDYCPPLYCGPDR